MRASVSVSAFLSPAHPARSSAANSKIPARVLRLYILSIKSPSVTVVIIVRFHTICYIQYSIQKGRCQGRRENFHRIPVRPRGTRTGATPIQPIHKRFARSARPSAFFSRAASLLSPHSQRAPLTNRKKCGIISLPSL